MLKFCHTALAFILFTYINANVLAALTPRKDIFASAPASRPAISSSGNWIAESSKHPGQIILNHTDRAKRLKNFIDLKFDRLYWYRWSSEASDTLLVAGDQAGRHVIYRIDPESHRASMLTTQTERAVYGFATPLNNYSFTIDRFKNTDTNQLIDLGRNGELVAVKDTRNLIPAYFGTDKGFLSVQFERAGQSFRFGQSTKEIQISSADQRQGSALVSITDEGKAYLLSSVNADTLGLLELDLHSGNQRVLARSNSDIRRVILNPIDLKPDALEIELGAPELTILEERIRPDLAYLQATGWGFPHIVDRSPNDQYWIIKFGSHENAPVWALYERSKMQVRPIKLNSQVNAEFAEWEINSFRVARENAPELRGYITLPAKTLCHDKTCPLLLRLHGGPARRDYADIDQETYWLVSRGIAVATINFRGSRGFGKKFEALDQKQWAKGIVVDVLQGLDYVLKNYDIDRTRVAAMGSSFGANLVLDLVARDKVIKCAVIDSATTDIVQFVEADIAKNGERSDLINRVGDTRLANERAELVSMSALNQIEHLKSLPLLQFHGERDAIVNPANNDAFIEKMLQINPNFTYVSMTGESHGLVSARADYAAMSEQFIGKCLQTLTEPLTSEEKDHFSTIKILGNKIIF